VTELVLVFAAASATEAVAIDKRDLTRSSGYVEPVGMVMVIINDQHRNGVGSGDRVDTNIRK
jgi:hypothetical protein